MSSVPTDDRETLKDAEEKAYLVGFYDAHLYLSRSPRFNKPQMEVIKDSAARTRVKLEALGVEFKDKGKP